MAIAGDAMNFDRLAQLELNAMAGFGGGEDIAGLGDGPRAGETFAVEEGAH